MEGAASASEARGSERVGASATAAGRGARAGAASVTAAAGSASFPEGVTLLIRRAARRLPPRMRRVLRVTYRRSQALSGQLRRRWHRSLQLRVVATTAIISFVVVAALGYFLMQQIATGLLNSARTSASTQI